MPTTTVQNISPIRAPNHTLWSQCSPFFSTHEAVHLVSPKETQNETNKPKAHLVPGWLRHQPPILTRAGST
ncbi:hypothetical protein HBH64_132390 [Parastagonospora nodorum]|nr:hypothetical protein HBH88_050280 [Parastagonospora nodorum]KAH4535945.1 hypothetical protein HBH87_004590 [Parastagonospora nodorum]KAH4733668.1 hypothetical protein HBH66_006130 [Parastagonospora nodorum]KAH4745726.1 hypothetical protein HBH64_132390 [Parastagonospora nodorum]KAH4764963.1 hypothetical protein HBH65_121050 [Parastagonospora nodorum]